MLIMMRKDVLEKEEGVKVRELEVGQLGDKCDCSGGFLELSSQRENGETTFAPLLRGLQLILLEEFSVGHSLEAA